MHQFRDVRVAGHAPALRDAYLSRILFYLYSMPSYLGGRFRALQMSRVGWVFVAIIRPSIPTLSCALSTHAPRQCPSEQACVSGEPPRPRPFGRTHEASADRLTLFPWASAAAPLSLCLSVSPHMRPRCCRESPLSHGLLLFRFPSSPSLSAATCALPIPRRFFRKALQPRYRRRRRLLLIPSYGIRIPRLLSLSPFPAAFSHPL